MPDLDGFTRDVIINLSASVIVGVGAFIAVWFRDSLGTASVRHFRLASALLTRRRSILFWIDDEPKATEKLAERLSRRRGAGDRTQYRMISRPADLLRFPLRPSVISAIVLFDTDVAKIAESQREASAVERQLERYVASGGGLIAGHDVIYRRVRSPALQRVFGYYVKDFARPVGGSLVSYQIQPHAQDHPLRASLPDQFDLDDGEAIYGSSIAPDCVVVYTTADEASHPLVVAREFGQGRVVWLNSGDKGDWLCGSLAEPDEHLAILVMNAIEWTSRVSK